MNPSPSRSRWACSETTVGVLRFAGICVINHTWLRARRCHKFFLGLKTSDAVVRRMVCVPFPVSSCPIDPSASGGADDSTRHSVSRQRDGEDAAGATDVALTENAVIRFDARPRERQAEPRISLIPGRAAVSRIDVNRAATDAS